MDPGPRDPQQPQSWNRFGYARNSPLVRIDPDGLADKVYVFQTLSLIGQYPMGGLKDRVEGATQYSVEVTNRASRDEIVAGLSRAEGNDIVLVFGHGNEAGIETNEGLFGGSGSLSNQEIAAALGDGTPPTGLVVGACFSGGAAEAAAGSGVRIAIGFSDQVPSAVAFQAVSEAVLAIAQGNDAQLVQRRADARIAEGVAIVLVFEPVAGGDNGNP